MPQTTRRPIAWGPLLGALLVGAVGAGVIAWHLHIQTIDRQVAATRGGLKKLVLSRGIPPNQDVMDYLTARQQALERCLQTWVKLATAAPSAEAAMADPQLYFQEQLHDVQRTLERAAAARTMPVPQQLGFPKELPPSDTVPRLLVQLSLIKELAALIFEQGVAGLSSFKIEDPDTVPEDEGEVVFLTRLPVRVRLTSSLPQLLKILAAIEGADPLIELRAIRLVTGATPNTLDAELTLARSLMVAAPEADSTIEQPEPPAKALPKRTKRKSAR